MLEAILAHKRDELRARYANTSLGRLRARAAPTDRSLAAALAGPGPRFVLECKHAAPSAGRLRDGFQLNELVGAYAPFAAAISVLTDARHFAGSFTHLAAIRAQVTQPVLCKDFVLTPHQVYEARSHGADGILLMLSALDDTDYLECRRVADSLAMDVLTEVHTEAELARAAALRARLVGINNRDLRTLAVDLDVTRRLAPRMPRAVTCIAESGIAARADVLALGPRVDGFLVGSALMRAPRLDHAVRALVFGRVKVCGLTSPVDARAAHAAGATYGGLNFVAASPRAVDAAAAARIVAAAPLSWVGVFADAPPQEVATRARDLGLAAVQLHGDEDARYCARLRALLPATCELWKAIAARDRVPSPESFDADRLVLDAPHPTLKGGTGRRFDWSLLDGVADRSRYVVAGGLAPDCARAVAQLDAFALDVNSGVESAPGRKDPARLDAFFTALRTAAGRREDRP